MAAKNESTDLGQLWSKAVHDYLKKTGKDLSRDLSARSIGDAMKFTERSMQSFSGFRHKDDKVDRVRSAFGRHLDGMQKCMKGIEAVGAAAGAFPPAMPVGIVFAACGHLLSAFAGVKADYDRVEEFFSQSSRFFERLSIIENKGVDSGALGKAIVRVFSAQLSICAIVEVMIKTKAARFKQWLIALWNMQDPDLAAAFAVMQESVEELGQTVGYASYAEIKNTQTLTIEVSGKADEIDENIKQFRSKIDQDLRGLYESHLSSTKVLTEGFRSQEALLREVQSTVLKALQGDKSKPDHQEKDKRQQTTKGSGKGDPGDKKFKALRNIKALLDGEPGIYPNWRDAYKENATQHEEMKEAYVEHTADWLTGDPIFQQWYEGKNPLLWIQGSNGIGKSFLAHKLAKKDAGHPTAYFYFKEDYPYLQSAHNAIACTALQIAESDTRYAEKVAVKMKEDAQEGFVIPTLDRFFLSIFNGTAQNNDHLYLVFDGLDEAPEMQRDLFLRILGQLREVKSNVHVLVTSRPDSIDGLKELNPLVLEVTKEKMIGDMKALIWNRLNTMGRLRKFSPTSKRLIARKVLRQADGMLYIEHMLRRLSYIGREGAVLKDLAKMPSNLEDLYKLMLDECRRNRSREQYEALKRLFAWLAFSKRSLSLNEASELVKLIVTEDHFDIEDEIIGRSARILELSRTRHLNEDHQTELDDDEDDDQAQSDEFPPEIDEMYRYASLTFQERSLRQYFRAVSVDNSGDEELRTPASAAHLTILKMCCEILVESAKVPKESDMPVLRTYAMIYWYEHFNELDVETASDEEVSEVLLAVHKIVSNKNNVAKLLERYLSAPDLYPERNNETTVPWYDRLHAWAVRGSSLPVTVMEDEVRAWSVELTAAPERVLLPLAKAHIRNWIEEPRRWYIREAYRFAEAALKISGKFTWFEEDPLKSILSVADAFGEPKRDGKTFRALGSCLFYAGEGTTAQNPDLAKTLYEEGRRYVKQSLENMEDDGVAKVYTLSTLAVLHQRNQGLQEAVETIDQALDCLESLMPGIDNDAQSELAIESQHLHREKANHLWDLGKKEAALSAFNAARKAMGEITISGYTLDDITNLLDDPELDPNGHLLMDTLKSWSDKERFAWFYVNLAYWVNTRALGRMYRAAKGTGETHLVLEWLDAYGKTRDPRSLLRFNAQSALADYQSNVLGNDDKAKEIMRATLAVHPKVGGTEEDVLNERITEVRLELASIIFSQFRESSDPKRKDALLEEMKSLSGIRTDDEVGFQESHIGMLVANMLRIMGPAREYQNTMERIFQTCINGLEDNVSWNDGDSLRLLAKVLSSLDGLERDARITISAQFSLLDRSIHESAHSPERNGTSENEHDSGDEPQLSPSSSINPEVTGQDISKTDSVETPDLQKGSTEKNSGHGDVGNNGDATSETSDTPQENERDENLSDFSVTCDGGCNRYINSWTSPFYLCIICPNTDLCEECHAKRQAWNRGETADDAWRAYCGKNHHYIKGPMKGWRGVKDGIIRIGEEEIAVKDWLRSLKEERWPKAWEAYWLRQGGLKDIDIED